MESIQKKHTTGSKTLDMIYIAVFAGVTAVCAWISVPAAVPFTMQTFAVFAAAGLLGGKRGTLSVIIYILLGMIGMPVFTGFQGGAGVLLGATGGYIVGFLVAVLIMWGMESAFGQKTSVLIVSMLTGLIACYAFGTVWFLTIYSRSTGAIGVMAVLGWCVFPFVIPDLLKIALAVTVTKRFKRYVDRR